MVLELARDRALDGPVTRSCAPAARARWRAARPATWNSSTASTPTYSSSSRSCAGELLRGGLQRLGDAGRGREARAQDAVARGGSRPAASTRSRRRARGPRAPTPRDRTARAARGSSGTSTELATRRRSTSPAVAQHDLALAVVAAPARLEHRRAARLASTASSRPARSSTAANSAVAIPRRRNSVFSASRSWATSSAPGGGSTSMPASTRRSAPRRPGRPPTRT